MFLEVLKDVYNEYKKTIKVILVLACILVILKVIAVVRNGFSTSSIERLVVASPYDFDSQLINSYDEYLDFIYVNGVEETLGEKNFKNNDYIAYFVDSSYCEEVIDLEELKVRSDKIILYFTYYFDCDRECEDGFNLYFIPVDKNLYEEVPNIDVKYEEKGDTEVCEGMMVDKPILYLYPEKDTNLTVKLERDYDIVTSYPKYNDGWNVLAKSNGDLYDENGKYYYALYWDEVRVHTVNFSEGFYVTKDNALDFLEDKLSIIGLSDRERNEFIMYWLPKLEINGQSLVYFELTDERESYNKLYISEEVDSLLRVNMHIKKVNGYVDIEEQALPSFERNGFVAVEWGGTIY